MATHFTGSSSAGVTLTIGSELWIVQAGAYLTNAGDAFSLGTTSDNLLIVDGTVISEAGDAITSELTSYRSRLQISETGKVIGFSDGIELADMFNVVVNHGIITGYGDAGVELRGDDGVSYNELQNFGSIYGGSEGVTVIGSYGTVTNFGEIIGGARGIEFEEAEFSRLFNSGRIAGDTALTIPSVAGDSMTIYNSGELVGRLAVTGGLGNETIYNSGSVIGMVTTGGGTDTISNSGTIEGDIFLGSDADVLRSARGLINGEISGGSGGDLILSGLGDDIVHGNQDDDTIRGNDGDDMLFGDEGLDTLYGGGGDDVIDGGLDNDILYGADGNDILMGNANADELYGSFGDDVLDGGSGNDTLKGGVGADLLIGGFNRDELYGGGDADIFKFGKNHSILGIQSDTIHDFQHGVDIIDLSDVSPGVLEFIGIGPFAGGGVASVRIVETAATGNSAILIDYDGDNAADMRIIVRNQPELTADDFLL